MPDFINRMRLRDFHLILAIRDRGQLAIAAEELGMTQPAASRRLAEIERTIGSKVFARHPKGMVPTPVGDVLARNAMTLMRSLDEAAQEVKAVSAGHAGTARVGSVTGGAVGFLVPAIKELKAFASGADIHVEVGPSDMLIEGLIRGEYDFVLSRIPSGVDTRQFDIQRGRVEIVNFLLSRNHPLASAGRLTLADLEGYEWVVQGPNTPIRQALEQAFLSRGAQLPREIVNTTSLLVMIAYLDSTHAIAPVSREVKELLAPQGASSGILGLELEEPIVINPYHVISLKNRVTSPLAVSLRHLVMKAIATP
jgi:DNA-binding transcriptional LysR family regulator